MADSPQHRDIIFYNTPTGDVKIEVIFNDETFWLTQKGMAELFGVESNTITYHLKKIFKTGELEETATARKIRIVQKVGNRDVSRDLDFYNLDAHSQYWFNRLEECTQRQSAENRYWYS